MTVLKKITIFLLTIGSLPFAVRSQTPAPTRDSLRPAARQYWQQEVSYTIDVSLNDTEHTLDGFIKMSYRNHSPDTLSFIWIHLWPNAFKNDQTAFSEQLLGNGRTDFYFSDKDKKGYINHLDFSIDGVTAKMEDHPRYIDIIKIILPHPLLPGEQITITTPFHEQLPFPFSGTGYNKGLYQITQWYPQPAVYDSKGWHEMPYLDQGGPYGEYGSFDVRITLPKDYTVVTTGELSAPPSPDPGIQKPKTNNQNNSPSPKIQNLKFKIQNSNSFSWFAGRHLRTDHDTLQLPSGRIIDVYAYHIPEPGQSRQNSIQHIKEAVYFRSSLIGEYPFNTISTVIPPHTTGAALDRTIEHQIGRHWFHTILGANERAYPWMSEGLNAYYDRRYALQQPTTAVAHHHPMPGWLRKKLPQDPARLLINTLAKEKEDQPVSTPAEDFTLLNYHLIAQSKTAIWMQQLEDSLGAALFDSCMQEYFRRWQFRHPYPEDFRAVMENTSHRDLSAFFAQLDKKGPVTHPKEIRPTFLFSARNTDRISYINIGPALGYNTYDHMMIGAVIHNFDLPPNAFQFLLAPLYATNSRRLNGAGYLGYSWYPENRFKKIVIGVEGAKFSSLSGSDSNGHQLFGGFYKIAPSLRLTLKNQTARSTINKWIEWKTYGIGEKELTDYVQKSTDSLSYPNAIGKYKFRYLNQLSFQIEDNRALYPYAALWQIQQGDRFYRLNFTGNYFFNYAAGGGMDLRFFAAKFGYIGGKSSSLDLSIYEPKLTGVSGSEDYTYSNYFVGRNEYTGLASRQIMIRDGGLKIRVPNFPWLEGRSDNWVSALNLSSTLPSSIVPRWMPLKVFLDIGTYAGAWQNNPETSRFLYTAGLQLSLFHNILHIYAPLFYSSDFSDQLKTLPDQNTFMKRLSFSIDLQNIGHHTPALATHRPDNTPF